MRRILVLLVLAVFFILPKGVFAEGEFETSYNVVYDVDGNGVTTVTEGITLKNLTDKYFASSFNFTIGISDITEVTATDAQGPMQVTVENTGKKAKVNVKFNQQIVGQGKEYSWTLKFRSKDFAQRQGKTWQVSVPRISDEQGISNYSLTLQVPVQFGDPVAILPEPKRQSEAGGKLQFSFNKEQLIDAGILANFGSNQIFDYSLAYHLKNDGLFTAIAKLPLPPSTQYQQVTITDISPKPENVVVDKDGNLIGLFRIGRKQSLEVKVSGKAKLYINNLYKTTLTPTEQQIYTQTQKYWDKDNPAIKTKLDEVFKGKNPQTNREKARLIYLYVSNFLQYDQERLKREDFQRLGSLAVLNNPNKALCSEFTDLFIALARSAGIPARELTGYAYTANQELRPLSLKDVLHAWPEFYDPGVGWVMVDPTWGNTTGGVDYFSKFDLNHFVLSIRGYSSVEPTTADQVNVGFSDEFQINPILDINTNSPQEVFAGFPSSFKLSLTNTGNYPIDPLSLEVTSSKITINGERSHKTTQIPPFGHLDYQYELRTGTLWKSYEDVIQIKAGPNVLDRRIIVRPFFSYKIFSYAVVATVTGIIMLYLLVLGLHFKYFKKK